MTRELDCYRGDDASRAELKEAAFTVAVAILQAGPFPMGSFWLGNETLRTEPAAPWPMSSRPE